MSVVVIAVLADRAASAAVNTATTELLYKGIHGKPSLMNKVMPAWWKTEQNTLQDCLERAQLKQKQFKTANLCQGRNNPWSLMHFIIFVLTIKNRTLMQPAEFIPMEENYQLLQSKCHSVYLQRSNMWVHEGQIKNMFLTFRNLWVRRCFQGVSIHLLLRCYSLMRDWHFSEESMLSRSSFIQYDNTCRFLYIILYIKDEGCVSWDYIVFANISG